MSVQAVDLARARRDEFKRHYDQVRRSRRLSKSCARDSWLESEMARRERALDDAQVAHDAELERAEAAIAADLAATREQRRIA
jgi:hypothetical protein